MYNTRLIATGALLFSTVLGFPKAMPQSVSSPSPSWTNSATGNITIVLSDTTMNFGNVTPSDALGGLFNQCYDQGTCNPNAWTVPAEQPGSPDGVSGFDLQFTVQTSFFPTWVKNGLIETLQAASGAATTTQSVPYDNICDGIPNCFASSEPTTFTEYTFPDGISIIYESPTGGSPQAVISIGIQQVNVEGDGFCSTFTTIGSAVTGAVSGAAGGLFTLLGLACQS